MDFDYVVFYKWNDGIRITFASDLDHTVLGKEGIVGLIRLNKGFGQEVHSRIIGHLYEQNYVSNKVFKVNGTEVQEAYNKIKNWLGQKIEPEFVKNYFNF